VGEVERVDHKIGLASCANDLRGGLLREPAVRYRFAGGTGRGRIARHGLDEHRRDACCRENLVEAVSVTLWARIVGETENARPPGSLSDTIGSTVELDEKAHRTEEDPQRKDRSGPIGFLWPDQSLGWRLSAEVADELEAVTAACAARASRPMPLQPGHRQAASPQFPARSSSARRRARATIVRVGLA
jgi:hypothetical protein